MTFEAIPKIENHLHLEGAIPINSLWQLIQKYGGDETVRSYNQLKDRFSYRDFDHFIETWSWKNQYIREYEDFVFISEAVSGDLIKQNIKYAEVFISPSLFKKRLESQRIIEAIAEGILKNSEIKINLIVDFVRDYGPENEMKTLFEISEVKEYGIIGIGIGGTEHKYPPGLFKDLYKQARKFGFYTTVHAGEVAGPESIWEAIRELKVDRIGHGTSAGTDQALMEYLSIHKIPVEICPISNLRTKAIHTLDEHPVMTFLDMGIPFSINTDDPKMFGNSLSDEYEILKSTFNLSDQDIYKMIINSIRTTWLNQEEKQNLISNFRKELNINTSNKWH